MATDTFPFSEVVGIRSALQLTQVELAKQLGVSQPLVAMWESGERIPNGPAAILLRQLRTQAETSRTKRKKP